MVVTDGPRRAKLSSFPSIDSPYTFLSSFVSYPDSVGSHFAGTVSRSSQIARSHGEAGQASCALSRDASHVGEGSLAAQSVQWESLSFETRDVERPSVSRGIPILSHFLSSNEIRDVRRIDVCEHGQLLLVLGAALYSLRAFQKKSVEPSRRGQSNRGQNSTHIPRFPTAPT